MIKKASMTMNQNTLLVSGDITLRGAMSVYRDSLPYFNQQLTVTFDFSGLHSSDSAGIALMVEWVKLAAVKGKKVVFQNIPPYLLSMAKAASMDTLLI